MQVFIYCRITVHVSEVHRTHHQEYIKLKLQPLVQVIVTVQLPPTWSKATLHCYYDLYQRLKFQFYVLLMMSAMDTRNMLSDFAENKYLHTVASCWILVIYVFDRSYVRTTY